jgi:hypothetical protein
LGWTLAKEHTWQEAIQIVLREAGSSLHYVRISERIIAQALKTKVGANPAASVAAILSQALSDENSPFQRVGNGEYALKETLRQDAVEVARVATKEEVEVETGALRAFGMFWQRDMVVWSGKPRLFGRQAPGASEVNFSEQVGVYLLHDRDRVIYVGRAADTMFARLRMHTIDRLGGRWDRFSWFGLRSVGEDGSLSEPSTAWTHTVVIETLEALLIESLEPPLNRRRGDNLSAVEYLQIADPEIDKMRKSQVISDMMKAAGMSQ